LFILVFFSFLYFGFWLRVLDYLADPTTLGFSVHIKLFYRIVVSQ